MSSQTGIWIDGEQGDSLPLPDRGLDFGDGLFETLLLRQGRILFPDHHWRRLQKGLAALAFPDCLAAAQLQLEQVADLARQRKLTRCALRLTITRGSAPRGYAPPTQAQPRIIITLTSLPGDELVMAPAAALCLADMRWSTQPQLAGLKHLNRIEQVLAAAEARAAGCDEALMLDQSGRLISVSAGNLFLVEGDQVLTPGLEHCGIAGTRRQLVIERWAPALGLTVVEAPLDHARLWAADEVFYSNSLQGLRPVASCGNGCWSQHPVCEALFRRYLGDAA